MSTHFALDATALLPPFLPVLRGQDLNFARLMPICDPDLLIGHIPAGVLHIPLEPRVAEREALWSRGSDRSFGALFRACLDQAAVGLPGAVQNGPRRMALLGRRLRELASLEWAELESLIRPRIMAEEAGRLRTFERWLHQAADTPWYSDLRTMASERLDQLLHSRPSYCADFPAESAGGRERLRFRLLDDFGALLVAWPSLLSAASILRRQGRGLLGEF
jgi:hypothetical protein